MTGPSMLFAQVVEKVVPVILRLALQELVDLRVIVNVEFCFQEGKFVFRVSDVCSSVRGFDSADPDMNIVFVEVG